MYLESGTKWLKEVGWVEKSITSLRTILGERNNLGNGSIFQFIDKEANKVGLIEQLASFGF